MSRIEFSAAARSDRDDITAYTIERFGLDQAVRLRDRFQATLEALVDSPAIGRSIAELDPPDRSYRYFVVMRRFVIVYEPIDDGIRVVRLLHGARNLAAEIERSDREDD